MDDEDESGFDVVLVDMFFGGVEAASSDKRWKQVCLCGTVLGCALEYLRVLCCSWYWWV